MQGDSSVGVEWKRPNGSGVLVWIAGIVGQLLVAAGEMLAGCIGCMGSFFMFI